MVRQSNMPDYTKSENQYGFMAAHLIWATRSDGTQAVGARTYEGMLQLTRDQDIGYYYGWNKYGLPDGLIYLMEELCPRIKMK